MDNSSRTQVVSDHSSNNSIGERLSSNEEPLLTSSQSKENVAFDKDCTGVSENDKDLGGSEGQDGQALPSGTPSLPSSSPKVDNYGYFNSPSPTSDENSDTRAPVSSVGLVTSATGANRAINISDSIQSTPDTQQNSISTTGFNTPGLQSGGNGDSEVQISTAGTKSHSTISPNPSLEDLINRHRTHEKSGNLQGMMSAEIGEAILSHLLFTNSKLSKLNNIELMHLQLKGEVSIMQSHMQGMAFR